MMSGRLPPILRLLVLGLLLTALGSGLAACGKKPGQLRMPPHDDGTTTRNSYPPPQDDL